MPAFCVIIILVAIRNTLISQWSHCASNELLIARSNDGLIPSSNQKVK